MTTLLLVSNDAEVRDAVLQSGSADGWTVVTAATAEQALELLPRQPDVLLLDAPLADPSGWQCFDALRLTDPGVPVLLLVPAAAAELVIEATARAPFDCLFEPLDAIELRDALARALEQGRSPQRPPDGELAAPAVNGDQLIGRCAAMKAVYQAIGRAAPQDVTVLILGESGTGKELVARALHQYRARSLGPFVPVNCTAIPETLVESVLFGHEKGAFTGANRRHEGKFEQARDGTLFLDEIGDMSGAAQAKLLRVLQEQCFERVGGHEAIQTNVRVLAATNQDPEQEVAAGRFRKDLYYRLNGFPVRLPPLRERAGDLPLLVDHFRVHFNRALHKDVRSVGPEALRLLEAHSWPGNVRELQSAVKHALLQATDDIVTRHCLPGHLRRPCPAAPAAGTVQPTFDLVSSIRQHLESGEEDLYEKVIQTVEGVLLREVLRHFDGNQVQASERLGMARNTLCVKLRDLGLAVERRVAVGAYI